QVLYQSFTCNDIGTNYFKWEIKNGEKANYYNTTESKIKLREAEVTIVFVEGNGTIHRNSETKKLVVNVFDVENNTYAPNVNVSFYVTHDGSTYQLDLVNKTDEFGNSTYNFAPDCNYNVGIQYWLAGVTDICYSDLNISENHTLTIKGDLINTIVTPNGEEYLRGTNITIRANVSDECGNLISDAQVNFTSIRNNQFFECTPVLNEGTGYYNCTFNTSSPTVMPARWYNISMGSSKPYHYDEITLKQNAFFIETEPILTLSMVNTSTYDGDAGSTGGYSEVFNFTVRVTDEDGDIVTAYVYLRKWNETANDWGEWTQLGFASCVDCNNTVLWKTKSNFDCTDMGEWQFKWNATDDPDTPIVGGTQYKDETTPENFTVEQDDIELQYVAGSNRTIWRNGTESIVLSVKVYDVDDQRYLATGEAQGKIWITYDHVHYDSGHDVSVTGGFFNYTFDPDNSCYYDVGIQYWNATTIGNTCFKDVSSEVFNVTLRSYLSATLNTPSGEPYKQGDVVPINFFVFDECNGGVSEVTRRLYLVTSGNTYTVESASITDYNNGTYTYNWDSTAKAIGWYNITVEAQKDYYVLVNSTIEYAFYLGNPPELQLESVDKTTGGWGETWTFEVQCRDLEGDEDNVTLWMKKSSTDPWVPVRTKQCQSTSWTTLTFTETFTCENITPAGETTYWKFNASDQWNFTDETSTHGITIEKDDVNIGLISGNGEEVNREGDDTEQLAVQIYDIDKNEYVGSGVQGIFYITYDGITWDSGTINTTDSSGILYYTFNPNCSYGVGVQRWNAGTYGDSCYKDKLYTSNFTIEIHGQLYNNIVTPYQGQTFHTTELVPIRFNVTSDCSNEGLIPNATVSIELGSPLDQWETCEPVYNETGAYAG
ncbi:hypothetical protein DRN74_07090, partial [Candidatus Micrarchaeota archaeon]